MFNINDTILYGTEGICKITEITSKKFGNKSMEYYVLKPMYNNSNSTVYVPTSNSKLIDKMRPISSPEEINTIINNISNEDCIWISDENTRKNKYTEIISKGNQKILMILIKTLYLHQEDQKAIGKTLHMSDKNFLKVAEKLLYDEFAHVLNIKPEQVLPFIMESIETKSSIPN